MESSRVNDGKLWDTVRLADIHPAETHYGSKHDYRVIDRVSEHLQQCQNVQRLLDSLQTRAILSPAVCERVRNGPEDQASSLLVRLLMGIASEPGSHHVIENLYLALLDCYEEFDDVWCRSMARERLRPAVMSELQLSDVNNYDFNVILQRLSSKSLLLQNASELKRALGLRDYSRGSATDLKEIIQQGISEKDGFRVSDLMLCLMSTPMLGRYVALLLPYWCCNPPGVYALILALQRGWTRLATHLGYSPSEIQYVVRAAGETVCKQIKMFMRVWWMPYLGEDRTITILQQVICDFKSSGGSPAVVDDGRALLKACVDGDWQNAVTLIEKGSPLSANTEDGRTPLMYACLRGQERVVQLLIDRGADPLDMDRKGDVCLHFPETLRNRSILECILKAFKRLDASVDVESLFSGCSPLSIACKNGAVNSAEILLAHGANPNGCKNGKHRPMVEASAQGHVGLVRSLLAYKANVNVSDQYGYTPLLQACNKNQWSVAQVLMDEGADINKCGIDCTGPLFEAVSANAYSIAAKLIKKGAVVDAFRFQPGANGDTVEMTPLCHAAGKGMNSMVKLLIDNGANVNYLCSDAMPAIAFAVLGDHIETFHMILDCSNLDKSLTGLSPAILTSVRTEKYYFTERLLDTLGGPQQALVRAQQNQMDHLSENILMYMQAVNHDQLSQLGLMPSQYESPAVVSQQITLQPEDQRKLDRVLNDFTNICVSAIRESPEIPRESLAEIAVVAGNTAAADFFRKMFSRRFTPDEMRCEFLHGAASPLRFVIENKILTAEIFQVEVFKFHIEDADRFYSDLVWAFHHTEGGENLPTNIDAMLSRLFSGRFTPRVPKKRLPSPPVSPVYAIPDVPMQVVSAPALHVAPAPAAVPVIIEKQKDTFPDKGKVQVPEPFLFRGINTKCCVITPKLHNPCDFSSKQSQNQYKLLQFPEELNNPETPPSSVKAGSEEVNAPDKTSGSVHKQLENVENNLTFSDTDIDRSPPVVRMQTRPPVSVPEVTQQLKTQNVYPPSPEKGSTIGSTGSTGEVSKECTEEEMFRLPNCTVQPTGTTLGHGSYGDVVEVSHKGKVYAAKIFRHIDVKTLLNIFGREQDILSRIRHRNIVPYYGVCKIAPENTAVIMMERMEMNLTTFFEDSKNVNTTLAIKFRLLSDVANGLCHLHKQQPAIIHRDLTASNVLLDSKNVAKIGDFGNSRTVDINATPELLTSNPGTLDYMPPEALEGGKYTDRLDVFSFGHLSIYVLIQHRPHPLLRPTFREHGKLRPRTEVERRQLYLDEVKTKLEGGVKHSFFKILINCLQDEPAARPSCAEILGSDVFLAFINNN